MVVTTPPESRHIYRGDGIFDAGHHEQLELHLVAGRGTRPLSGVAGESSASSTVERCRLRFAPPVTQCRNSAKVAVAQPTLSVSRNCGMIIQMSVESRLRAPWIQYRS